MYIDFCFRCIFINLVLSLTVLSLSLVLWMVRNAKQRATIQKQFFLECSGTKKLELKV